MKKIILSAILACLFVFNTQAQDETTTKDDTTTNDEAALDGSYNKWQARFRVIAVAPEPYFYDNVNGFDPDFSTSFAPEIDITYFLSKNISLELMLTTSKHDVEVEGGIDLGSVSILPPTLSMQYHFYADDFKPYIGAGINYTIFYGEDSGDIDSISYKNEIGYAVQAGLDLSLIHI